MTGEVDILLVDDNVQDVELTLRALRHHKLASRIHVAHDGEQALDFMFCRNAFAGRAFDAPPKVVLLDLKMPKVGGIEVLRALRADPRTRATPIVILTSSREQRDIVEGYQLGVNAFIQKPVDFDQFDRVIEQLGKFWLTMNQPPPTAAFAATESQAAARPRRSGAATGYFFSIFARQAGSAFSGVQCLVRMQCPVVLLTMMFPDLSVR